MSPWLLIPAAALAVGLIIEIRRGRRVLKQARADLRTAARRAGHQERLAQRAVLAQARTGHVDAAPRLVPLADVIELRAGRMTLTDYEERDR